MSNRNSKNKLTAVELDELFRLASERYERRQFKSAFRLFLEGAEAGDRGAQLNVASLYHEGEGVKRNRASALSWWKRAYRQGFALAASNIGVVYLRENKLSRALFWFQRATALKDEDANLEIARIYLRRNDRMAAIRHLKRATKARAGHITEASRETAHKLLKGLGNSPAEASVGMARDGFS